LSCEQSNTSRLDQDLNLNGTNLNWWLQEGRIKHLLHEEKIPISKQMFSHLGKYLLEKDSFLFSISGINAMMKLRKVPNPRSDKTSNQAEDELKERIMDQRYNENEMPPDKNAPSKYKDSDILAALGMDLDFSFAMGPSLDNGNDIAEATKPTEPVEVDFQGLEEDGNLNQEDFFKMLGGDLSLDLQDFKVIEEVEDSDNEDIAVEFIREEAEKTSDDSSDKYLKFEEFQKMVPKVETTDIVFQSGKSHSTNRLRKFGDPTHFIVRQGYAEQGTLNVTSVKDKVSLLYKLKNMVHYSPNMTDYELLLSLTLIKDILKSLEDRETWKIKDDIVFHKDDYGEWSIFLKYTGFLTQAQTSKLLMNGGFLKYDEPDIYALIPLNNDRQVKLLDEWSDTLTVTKFINIEPLEICHYRLFLEPFKRIGFASQVLSELGL
jgi:hypothetical protein